MCLKTISSFCCCLCPFNFPRPEKLKAVKNTSTNDLDYFISVNIFFEHQNSHINWTREMRWLPLRPDYTNLWKVWPLVLCVLWKAHIYVEEWHVKSKEATWRCLNPATVTFGVLMCSITDIQNGGWETEDFGLMFPVSGYIPRLGSVKGGFGPWELFRVFTEMCPMLSVLLTHLFI